LSTSAIAELEPETMLDNTAPVEVAVAPVSEEVVVKRSKGRPNIHPFAGRTYLLKNELKLAMQDKEAFVSLMKETYPVSDERKKALGTVVNAPSELSFTIHGPIRNVIEQLHKLRGIYGDKAKINISKERMVAPTSALYLKPIQEVIGERKGKSVYKRIFEEYRSDTIYGYVVVAI